MTIEKDLVDTHKLDVRSANLKMAIAYESGSMPTEAQFSDTNVKSNDDCARAIANLSRKPKASQRFNFFYDGTSGLVAQNGERVITFDVDCSEGGCRDAAAILVGIEIPARHAARWLKGCAALAN